MADIMSLEKVNDPFKEFEVIDTATPEQDEFAEFEKPEEKSSEYATTALKYGAKGAASSAAFVPGFMAGMQATAPLNLAPPWGNIASVGAGIIGGMTTSMMTSKAIEEFAGVEDPSQLPDDLRSTAYAAETFGGVLSFTGAPLALAKSGYRFTTNAVGNHLNKLMDMSLAHKGKFITAEVSSGVTSALGAGIAEEFVPGNAPVRIGAETVGGFISPVAIFTKTIDHAKNITRKAVTQYFSESARETMAAKYMDELFKLAEEDPVIIGRLMRADGILDDDKLTMAQKTGSDALAALEIHLTGKDPNYRSKVEQNMADSLDALKGMLVTLPKTGDVVALKAAAGVRESYYRGLIQARIESANSKAAEAASRITQDTPGARTELSVVARKALDDVIKEARIAEGKLWEIVPQDLDSGFVNLQDTFKRIEENSLPELKNKEVPSIVRKFLDRVTSPKVSEQSLLILPENLTKGQKNVPVGTTTGEMKKLRTSLLDEARKAGVAGDYGQARIYNELAEAVLDDIDSVFKDAGNEAYDQARAFSKEFNDTFTRSFVGNVTSNTKYGDRVAPELLVTKALASGKDAGAIQLQELEEATRFMVTRGLESTEAVDTMLDAQERIIRLAASQSTDPLTGKVNPKALAKFTKENELLMKRFPEIKKDINVAISSELARFNMEMIAKKQDALITMKKEVGKVLKRDPVEFSRNILLSNNMDKELSKAVKQLTKGNVPKLDNEEAMRGLRGSIFEAAVTDSTVNGTLSLDKFKVLMLQSPVASRKAPLDIMLDQGVIDDIQHKNIRKIFSTYESLMKSKKPDVAISVPETPADAVSTFLAKITGASIAGAGSRAIGSSTPSLIVHGEGSRMMQHIVNKIPNVRNQETLVKAMTDKELMGRLLSKTTTPEQEANKARYLNAWLIQSGIIAGEDFVEQQFEADGPYQVIRNERSTFEGYEEVIR